MTGPFDLTGRVALVTGGAGGLGSAICTALAHAGAAVAVHHLGQGEAAARVADGIASFGVHVAVVEADLTTPEGVAETLDRTERELGEVDIVVNNAGIMDERPFLEMPRSSWDAVLSIDLTAVAMMAQAAIGRMTERGTAGVLVNVASQVPLRGSRNSASYAAAKGGVLGLTRALAREFGPDVRVAAIAPGPILTPLTAAHSTDPAWVAARVGSLIDPRFADPADVAPSVVFLAADSGRLFHGQTLHVNGGGVLQ